MPARPLYHIYLYIATDGTLPGRDSILNISARHVDPNGGVWDFSQNVIPQRPEGIQMTKFWIDNPEAVKQMKVGTLPLPSVLTQLNAWLRRFPGRKLALTTSREFAHLYHAYLTAGGGKCVFGSTCLDLPSYRSGMEKEPERRSITIYPSPVTNLDYRVNGWKTIHTHTAEAW